MKTSGTYFCYKKRLVYPNKLVNNHVLTLLPIPQMFAKNHMMSLFSTYIKVLMSGGMKTRDSKHFTLKPKDVKFVLNTTRRTVSQSV